MPETPPHDPPPHDPPPHDPPQKRRALAEGVSVHPMPVGLAAFALGGGPAIALCLQLSEPPGGLGARVVGCSLAASFGPGDAGLAGEAGGVTVAVIRPLPRPRSRGPWVPGLGRLVGLAARAAGLPPERLKDEPIVLALYADLPPARELRALFHPDLPKGPYPRWLRLRVPDFAGRVFAASVWAQDLTAALGGGGLETAAMVFRPAFEGPRRGPAAAAPGDGGDPSLERAAEQARLALVYALRVQHLRPGVRAA